MSLETDNVSTLVDAVIVQARRAAPGADVYVSITSGRSANTRFARNQITSTGDVDETKVSVGIAFGKRYAAATTNQVDAASMRRAIDQAARLAKLAPEDPERMPPLGAQRYAASTAAYDQATARLRAESRADAARTACTAAEAAGLQIAGFYAHDGGVWALGNSAGLRAVHRASSASLTMTARTA